MGVHHQLLLAILKHQLIIFDEVIDTFLRSLKDRFEQESYHYFAKLENVLLTAVNGDTICQDGIQLIKDSYSEDIDVDSLLVELSILEDICDDIYIVCFDDVRNTLKKVPEKLSLIPNVVTLDMLLLVNPSTSATPERTFSLARRLKTWNRSTMTQKRFNSIAVLSYHKQRTDKINLVNIANEFVSKHDERKIAFGQFVPADFQ